MRRILGLRGQENLSASLRRVVSRGDSARAKGDAARDRREWPDAETHYRRHLEGASEDAAIWVQLGHALKESGKKTEAEVAYRTALALMPEDADVHLQIGHLLKQMGRSDEAMESYAASARLLPTGMVSSELATILQGAAEHAATQGEVYLPINDLLHFLSHHTTVSGIQRVQLNLITVLLELDESYIFVYSRGKDLWSIPRDKMQDLAKYASRGRVDLNTMRRMISAAENEAESVSIRGNDVLLILGSFWDSAGNAELLWEAKENKATFGIYFHDLIPVTHREYVIPQLSVEFSQALVEALNFIDFGLSNSNYAATEVTNYVAGNGLRTFPVTKVPLAHTFSNEPPGVLQSVDQWTDTISELRDESFVLCVGTIEVRKNHQYLFNVWKALVASGVEPPILVLVGRQGWGVSDFIAQLQGTFYLDGRIKVIHDLSDGELVTLYRHCLFTAFPSVVEGWGLPVGESLSYGKVCVASNTASIPEVGGDLVDYIDPWNLHNGVEVFRNLIVNPSEIVKREASIRDRFEPRAWKDVGADVIAKVAASRKQAPKPPQSFRPLLASGTSFKPANFASLLGRVFGTAVERQQSLILASGWSRPESFGVWMKGNVARLSFRTDTAPGTELMIYMRIALTIVPSENMLEARPESGPSSLIGIPQNTDRMTARVRVLTDAGGGLGLTLRVKDPSNSQSNNDQRVRVGLVSLAYAALDDDVSRAEILETFLLDAGREAN